MEQLPEEVLINEIITRLSVRDLLHLCQTSGEFAKICEIDELWRLLTARDFPEEVRFKPHSISWKEYYITVNDTSLLPIYLRSQMIDLTRLTPYNLEGVISRLPSDKIIVFTDNFVSPLAYYDGTFHLLTDAPLIRKVVLLPPGTEVNRDSVLRELTSRIPGGPEAIYGYVNFDGSLLLGIDTIGMFDRIFDVLVNCDDARSGPYIRWAIRRLNLESELDPIDWHTLVNIYPAPWAISNRACLLVKDSLRERGLILNEVYP